MFFLIADSFRRYLVGKLSMQSTIISALLTRLSVFSGAILSWRAVTFTWGFIFSIVNLPERALLVPILVWSCNICLLRFVTSSLSKSQIIILPIPATARYIATGE